MLSSSTSPLLKWPPNPLSSMHVRLNPRPCPCSASNSQFPFSPRAKSPRPDQWLAIVFTARRHPSPGCLCADVPVQRGWKALCIRSPHMVRATAFGCSDLTDPHVIPFFSSCSVRVFLAEGAQLLRQLDLQNIAEIGFSPRGTYLSTWERPGESPSVRWHPFFRQIVSG